MKSYLKKMFSTADERDTLFRATLAAADNVKMTETQQQLKKLTAAFDGDPQLPGMVATIVARMARADRHAGIDLCLYLITAPGRVKDDEIDSLLSPLLHRLGGALDRNNIDDLSKLANIGVALAEQAIRSDGNGAQEMYAVHTIWDQAIGTLLELAPLQQAVPHIIRGMQSISVVLEMRACHRLDNFLYSLKDDDRRLATELARRVLRRTNSVFTPPIVNKLLGNKRAALA